MWKSSCAFTTSILDGWRISERIRAQIGYKVESFYHISGKRPGLAVLRIGDEMEMERYVYAKKQLAFQLGIQFIEYQFPSTIDTNSIQQCIHQLNEDQSVHGIIVQLPLPHTLNTDSILNSILPMKDVDGCCEINRNQLKNYSIPLQSLHIPCAAMAMQKGKKAAIIGTSLLVGQPCCHLLQRQGCECSMCDIHTKDIPSISQQADLIVTAVGKPKLVTGNWVKQGAVMIDIGTKCVKDSFGNYVLAGDVDLDSCIGKASAITPVPGGVALLTTAMLMYNTLRSFVYYEGLSDLFQQSGDTPISTTHSL